MELSVVGTTKLTEDGLRVILDEDFNKYYRWHVRRATFNCVEIAPPKHGCHITITTKKLHGDKFNYEYLKQYDGVKLLIEYDTYIYTGGRGFTNYWIKVDLPLGKQIKDELGIVENGFRGFHVVVGNTKTADNYGDWCEKKLEK